MNKTNIEWCDYTWNPVTGCLHGCDYCYARRFAERGLGEYGKHPKAERFTPRFHPERLGEPAKVKKPSKVFVGSMTDMFGYWNDRETVLDVLRAAGEAPWHTYIWLTKNPKGMSIYNPYWSEVDWVGASVTCEDPEDLPAALRNLERVQVGVRFISFEPLLGVPLLKDNAANVLDWIIIGAQTGPGAEPVNIEWVAAIKRWADDHNVPAFIKDSCGWWSRYQKFPREAA